MNNQDANNETIIIEDLATQNTEEIKGGPSTQSKRTVLLKSTVAEGQDDNKLQSTAHNHNETVSEDSEAETQKLADLTMDDETESAIKGGMWLPAVQKVREVAIQPTAGGAGKASFTDLHI